MLLSRWWSELPREAICDEESHSKLLQILDELVTLLRTVVRTESEVEEKRRITDKLVSSSSLDSIEN